MLILMTLVLPQLSIAQAGAATPSADCFVDQGLGRAPANPPMLLDLPASRAVDGGILVAPERAADVAWRLECYQRWPQAAQIALDAQAQAATVELAEQRRVTEAVARLRLDEQPASRWPPWLVATLAGGAGAAVGLAAGLILGSVAHGS